MALFGDFVDYRVSVSFVNSPVYQLLFCEQVKVGLELFETHVALVHQLGFLGSIDRTVQYICHYIKTSAMTDAFPFLHLNQQTHRVRGRVQNILRLGVYLNLL